MVENKLCESADYFLFLAVDGVQSANKVDRRLLLAKAMHVQLHAISL